MDVELEISPFRDVCPKEAYGSYYASLTSEVNVVLIGKSGSGKSTFLKSLLAPNYTCKMAFYSQTKIPTYYTIPLFDEEKQKTWIVNIIDTPGLCEKLAKQEDIRNDDIILDSVSVCIRNQVTKIHCVCFFYEAGGMTDEDLAVFKKYIDLFSESSDSDWSPNSMLIITHADQLDPEEVANHKLQVETAPRLQFIRKYCQLGIFFSGMVPYRNRNNPGIFLDELVVYRKLIMNNILSTANHPITVLKIEKVVRVIQEELQSRTILEVQKMVKETSDKYESIIIEKNAELSKRKCSIM